MDMHNKKFLPIAVRGVVTLGLALVLAAIHYGVYFLRFEGEPPAPFLVGLQESLLLVVALKTTALVWFGLHRGWGRFVTFHDLIALAEATTLGSLLIVLADHLWLTDRAIPRGIIILDWGTSVIVLCGLRSVGRSMRDRYRLLFARGSVAKRVLIVGANHTGENLLRSIHFNGRIAFQVVGFIDHDDHRVGELLAGVPIVGAIERACQLARSYSAEEILITAGEVSGQTVRRVVDDCRLQGIRVKMLPSYEQLINGQVAVKVRDVAIDDLLHRDPVSLDTAQIHQWLEGRTLMVTGSAGSIGSEVCRQLLQFAPAKIVLVDRSENGQFHVERQIRELAPHVPVEVRIADIADTVRMEQLFHELRPEILFHAAAYKHVPLMEQNPGEGVKNNVVATRRLADLADEFGLQAFVLISTDKAVNPTSVMGACKRTAELYVQSLAERSSCRFVTVRFGNVLDSAGSVVPIFREQIARGGPVTITDERMQRYFMTIPEAAQLVIQAGAMGQGGEIFVLEMGEPVRIVDLAHDMIRLSGLNVGQDIEIQVTGLRPGEKLFEELHIHGETHQPTRHPKIRVAKCATTMSAAELADELDHLQSLVDAPADLILGQLQKLVVQYRPEIVVSSGPRLFHPEKEETDRDGTRHRAA
ncbi:MAG: polysaccharide biosynthesis protein [Planctomycetia bacterium]|nr:polysaccharide biosynthesis protein [Planctomycetia bacterium]